jgi:hypothetical protein
MRKRVLTLLTSSFLSFKSFDAFSRDMEVLHDTELFSNELKRQMAEEAFLALYNQIDFNGFARPDYKVFRKGLIGFLNIQKKLPSLNKESILTLIDFQLPSTEKRMWVIDLNKAKVLFNELVAHGKNSGNLYAESFSNEMNSLSSSLGFYLTGEVYVGKYGRSLRLDGLEEGYNERARARAVVLHGADYVSQAFVDAQGRLGRSYGCPAVAYENKDAIVDAIADRTVLFINGADARYAEQSELLRSASAFEYFAARSFSFTPSA